MNTPKWFLPEISFAGEEHLDTHYVQHYEDKAGTDPQHDLALLRDLGLDKHHTLIDIGAGTGTFALAAANYCQRVVAIDVSPAMINALRQKIVHHKVENVECIQSGFLGYTHQGDLADFVYTRHVLHHLPDFWKVLALRQIATILKPGGVLCLTDLIYSFEPPETEHVLETWFSNAPERHEDGWTRSELEVHVREEHSTFHWLLEVMIERAGFKIQNINHSSTRVHSTYICIKQE